MIKKYSKISIIIYKIPVITFRRNLYSPEFLKNKYYAKIPLNKLFCCCCLMYYFVNFILFYFEEAIQLNIICIYVFSSNYAIYVEWSVIALNMKRICITHNGDN